METWTSFYYHCPGHLQEENSICSEFWDCIQGQTDIQVHGRALRRAGPAGWFPEPVPRMAEAPCQAEVGAACCPALTAALAPSCKASSGHGCGSLCSITAEVQLSKSAERCGRLQAGLSGKRLRRSQDLPVHCSVLASYAEGAAWVLSCGTAVKTCKCEPS